MYALFGTKDLTLMKMINHYDLKPSKVGVFSSLAIFFGNAAKNDVMFHN